MRNLLVSMVAASAIVTAGTMVAEAGSFFVWGHEFTTSEAAPQQFTTSRDGPIAFNAMSETGGRAHRRRIPASQVWGRR